MGTCAGSGSAGGGGAGGKGGAGRVVAAARMLSVPGEQSRWCSRDGFGEGPVLESWLHH